jgi:hypothetical protein
MDVRSIHPQNHRMKSAVKPFAAGGDVGERPEETSMEKRTQQQQQQQQQWLAGDSQIPSLVRSGQKRVEHGLQVERW